MRNHYFPLLSGLAAFLPLYALEGSASLKLAAGQLQGDVLSGGAGAVYKGIPFGQPPVGDLRWKPPQSVKAWTGVRKANQFGPRCMQNPVFGDMGFRSDGMNEDCLYLNIWTPAKSAQAKLPVLIYFYGGGHVAGDGSERRYDGEAISRKGVITITANYRLGIFGYMAHPELTKESARHASGTMAFWIRQRRFAGCTTTSRPLAAIPRRLRSPANRRVRRR